MSFEVEQPDVIYKNKNLKKNGKTASTSSVERDYFVDFFWGC